METTNEQLNKEEIEVRNLLQTFFAKVAEMPTIEQVRILADFKEFMEQQQQKSRNIK